jgi:hypothetical protein
MIDQTNRRRTLQDAINKQIQLLADATACRLRGLAARRRLVLQDLRRQLALLDQAETAGDRRATP